MIGAFRSDACEYVHAYTEVLTVSSRKGTHKWQIAQHGLIYKSICDMLYVYFWVYACKQRGSKCERSQGHKHTLWFDIHKCSIYDMTCVYLWVNEYLYKEILRALAEARAETNVNSHNVSQYTKTSRRKRYRRTKMMKMTVSSQRGAFFSFKTSPKKRSICFVNNNPSMTLAWKRATATFSHIFFNVSAVASIRFFPVHSHRHWKERMHFHIWGLRAWPFFDGKLPGMVCLRTFQNPSTWPLWILTFPLFFRVLVRQKMPWLWLHCCKRRPYFLAKAGFQGAPSAITSVLNPFASFLATPWKHLACSILSLLSGGGFP